jgi:hypothetical protein
MLQLNMPQLGVPQMGAAQLQQPVQQIQQSTAVAQPAQVEKTTFVYTVIGTFFAPGKYQED